MKKIYPAADPGKVSEHDEKVIALHQEDKFNDKVRGLRSPQIGRVLSNTVTLKLYKAQEGGFVSDLTIAYPNKNSTEEIARSVGDAFMALLRKLPEETAKKIYEDVVGITARKEHEASLSNAEAIISKIKFKAKSPTAWKNAKGTIQNEKSEKDKEVAIYCFERAEKLGRLLQASGSDTPTKEAILQSVNLLCKYDGQSTRAMILGILCQYWIHGEKIAIDLGITYNK